MVYTHKYNNTHADYTIVLSCILSVLEGNHFFSFKLKHLLFFLVGMFNLSTLDFVSKVDLSKVIRFGAYCLSFWFLDYSMSDLIIMLSAG